MRSLVLARDDVVVGTCCVLWMLTVFLTEEHKNKRFPLILECSCKWICDTFLNQCFASAVLSLRLSFVVKNRRSYGIANYAKLSFLAGTRNLVIMVCRMCFVLSLALCCFWDKIPGPGQGWRRRWRLWCFVDAYCILRQKNIRTKVCIEEFNIHSNGFDVYSNSSMLAPAVLSFQLFLLNMNRRLFLLFL